MHGGGEGACVAGGMHGRGACLAGGGVRGREGACMVGKTAVAAGGTGMHSYIMHCVKVRSLRN